MHTIYYMEDDGDISASVTEYLSRREFLVRCFSTAAGMRQALLKFRPDLLILDWNMPDGAGMSCADGPGTVAGPSHHSADGPGQHAGGGGRLPQRGGRLCDKAL